MLPGALAPKQSGNGHNPSAQLATNELNTSMRNSRQDASGNKIHHRSTDVVTVIRQRRKDVEALRRHVDGRAVNIDGVTIIIICELSQMNNVCPAGRVSGADE